ncbi:MAG: hypothetical protein AAF153_00800, partial [Pseudomonadota bacterium]
MKQVSRKLPWLPSQKRVKQLLAKASSPARLSVILHLMLLLMVFNKISYTRPPEDFEVFSVDLVKFSKIDRISTKAPESSKSNNNKKNTPVKSASVKTAKPEAPKAKKETTLIKTNPNTKSNNVVEVDAKKAQGKKKAKPTTKRPVTQLNPNKATDNKDSDDKSLLKNLTANKSDTATPKRLTSNIDKNFAIGEEAQYTKLTVSEQTLIRSQIERAWVDMPAGAKGVANLSVTLLLELREDGSVKAIRLKSSFGNQNKVMKAFADSAVRAAYRASP